jgi:hypothetical protein
MVNALHVSLYGLKASCNLPSKDHGNLFPGSDLDVPGCLDIDPHSRDQHSRWWRILAISHFSKSNNGVLDVSGWIEEISDGRLGDTCALGLVASHVVCDTACHQQLDTERY